MRLFFALLILTTTAAHAETVIATAGAVVLERLELTNKDPLNFGFVSPGASGGNVVITPQGMRNASGTVEISGAFSRATFEVIGTPGRNYSVQVPASQQFTAQENGASLTVQSFQIQNNGALGANGKDEITLGGTLIVPANAAPGTYSGYVPITVSY